MTKLWPQHSVAHTSKPRWSWTKSPVTPPSGHEQKEGQPPKTGHEQTSVINNNGWSWNNLPPDPQAGREKTSASQPSDNCWAWSNPCFPADIAGHETKTCPPLSVSCLALDSRMTPMAMQLGWMTSVMFRGKRLIFVKCGLATHATTNNSRHNGGCEKLHTPTSVTKYNTVQITTK